MNQDIPLYRGYHMPGTNRILGVTAIPAGNRLFGVGDTVTRAGFTDSSGVWNPTETGLTVTDVTKHVSKTGSHWRVRASRPDGGYREASQRFFRLEWEAD